MKFLKYLENTVIGFVTVLIALLIMIILHIFISFSFSIKSSVKKLKGTEVYKRCRISPECRQCYFDCKRFGMKYSRYNPGGFGTSSCWCMKKNNIPVRIW